MKNTLLECMFNACEYLISSVQNEKRKKKYRLRKEILQYYKTLNNKDAEQEKVLSYLKTHKIAIFPYLFPRKFKTGNIKVFSDSTNGMRYVLLDDKRLYFKRSWNEKQVKKAFSQLLLEQDKESPHRYHSDDFQAEDGAVYVDAGCAEGNFAILIVEKASKIFLFEADEEWIEPLKATFEPWKDKIVIVNKYISDKTTDNSISLDDYFQNEHVDFIKADIEGAEVLLLNGAKQILSNSKKIKLVLCTYHKHEDAETLKMLLEDSGFSMHFSKGYMIFRMYDELKPPYLRHGLIRASKQ